MLRSALSGKISATTLNFLMLLVEKRRQGCLEEIATEYRRLQDAGAGILRGEVATALPFENGGRSRLEQALSARFAKRVLLSHRMEPRMVGGAQIQVGDYVIDGGFDHRLRQLRRQLLEKGASR